MTRELWTIVLAAGAGRRLAPVTGGVPKQYWRPDGGRSLVEETAARLRPLAVPERTVTVVDAGHTRYLEALEIPDQLGTIVRQPMDRGTAAGVLLPLLAVIDAAPDATVIITPSDHGVDDGECFRKGLNRALAHVDAGAPDIVLFGVAPSMVSADYGWITPAVRGTLTRSAFQKVASFVEKPPLHEALRLFSAGAVWNTMVVVARAQALFQLFERHLSFHADVMMAARKFDPHDREAFLHEWYPELPAADFCRDLLTPATENLWVYSWPQEMGWTDLGTPDRLEEWLSVRRRSQTAMAIEGNGVQQVA